MSAGTSLLSMYAGAMNTNVAIGYEMMCFIWLVGLVSKSDCLSDIVSPNTSKVIAHAIVVIAWAANIDADDILAATVAMVFDDIFAICFRCSE